jgi:EAL domain-containing protein (putative c-di-GMP-specific phosphodiesterase class I)/CheY-like chemotaxis protein
MMAAGRVLIVDDDEHVLFVLAEVLRKAGHDVVTAGSATAGLALVRDGELDVLVSDIRMPDMDGVGLLRKVREVDLDLPVVLVTGSPDVETATSAVEHGALRYLTKPVAAETLTDVVAQAVRLCRLGRWKRRALDHVLSGHRLVGDRAAVEAAFHAALESLKLAAQPIQRPDGSRFGLELLVRTASRALPNPVALFDAAERLDLVHALGREVRRRAAAVEAPGQTLFINLHALDLVDEDLFARDAPLTSRARDVVLEITERASLDNVPDLVGRVEELRRLGYRIAVDDLGAGYSGLNTFASLAPDVVKLDMSLVRGADSDPVRRKLVGSLAALCHELAMTVVAEGIETEGERACMVDLGCDLLQGFLLGPPELVLG